MPVRTQPAANLNSPIIADQSDLVCSVRRLRPLPSTTPNPDKTTFRRAFPPECFQVLPLPQVTSRPFEAIVASGSAIQLHDKEHLRDQGTTLFLRQGNNYGLNRFLGILVSYFLPLKNTQAHGVCLHREKTFSPSLKPKASSSSGSAICGPKHGPRIAWKNIILSHSSTSSTEATG